MVHGKTALEPKAGFVAELSGELTGIDAFDFVVSETVDLVTDVPSLTVKATCLQVEVGDLVDPAFCLGTI